jgi:hypothetical protein
LKAQRTRASSTGRSLVVLKTQIIEERCQQYFDKENISITERETKPRTIKDRAAFFAGFVAGAAINLSGSRIADGVQP